jgi:hypothetical protein
MILKNIEVEEQLKAKRAKKAAYMREYRKTPKGKASMDECKKKYAKTENGKAKIKASHDRTNPRNSTSYAQYKNNAKKRNKDFELTEEEFNVLKSPNCHYCNINYNNSGIDRKDNNIGYVFKNCVPCCKICNIAKASLGYEEFREWVKRIYNHFGKSEQL